MKERHNALLLALERPQGDSMEVRTNPPLREMLRKGDNLILVAGLLPKALG